jgi:hypothetical protein
VGWGVLFTNCLQAAEKTSHCCTVLGSGVKRFEEGNKQARVYILGMR